jgi:hypothetical protein
MHRNNTLESLGAGICNPDHGSLSVHNAAQTEFTNFVMDTYHELYRIESQVLGGKPSMALFCRFDIGITERINGFTILLMKWKGRKQPACGQIDRAHFLLRRYRLGC